jgi:Putative peptidoglycan binding domain
MRGITAPVLAILAVLYTLIVLLSADRTPSGPALVKNQERIPDLGFGLIETIMLHRRQQQSKDHPGPSNVDRIMKVQQALKDDGFYSGPVDGVLRQSTREAIRSFQQSKHLNVTESIDDETTRELRLQ